jgi:dolichol-phosphate mannosyltransferase
VIDGDNQKIVVVIPTYNEADNLPLIAAELWTLDIAGLEILVVDDNSPDGTGKVAEELMERRPGAIHVMHRLRKQGLGTAYIDGFNWALDAGADLIIQMDADFSHSPRYIPQMLETIPSCDVVVGSRYVQGGTLDGRWGFGRQFLSWWANSIYTRIILGVHTKDTTAGFKCWRAETLRGMDLGRIYSNGYVFQVEMTYVAEKLGYQIVEIPIYFEDRRVGSSKMTMPVKIEAMWRVWEVLWRHRHLTPDDRRHSRTLDVN